MLKLNPGQQLMPGFLEIWVRGDIQIRRFKAYNVWELWKRSGFRNIEREWLKGWCGLCLGSCSIGDDTGEHTL